VVAILAWRRICIATRGWTSSSTSRDAQVCLLCGIPHKRYAHASWLLAGGADIQIVKERMGPSSIMTTQKYLHSLPNADAAAVTALETIRNRSL
jgi:integrase